jgi:drug/metabolite transporter (DMT)-like permease
MFFLILAILCSFTNSLLIKQNEDLGIDTRIVLASNYVSAVFLGWVLTLVNGVDGLSTQTLLLSGGGGILWPVSFYMLMWGIRQYGLSLAGAISRLSLSVPILFAVLFLREKVTPNTTWGIIFSFIAVLLLNPGKSDKSLSFDKYAVWFFPLLILIFGLVDGWVNVFNHLAPQTEKYLFITLTFTFSGIIAWIVVIARGININRTAVYRGLLLGVPNFLSTVFLLESLQTPFFSARSTVVYTLFSVSGVILAFGAGNIFWKEKLTKSNVLGVISAVAAIILLNTG